MTTMRTHNPGRVQTRLPGAPAHGRTAALGGIAWAMALALGLTAVQTPSAPKGGKAATAKAENRTTTSTALARPFGPPLQATDRWITAVWDQLTTAEIELTRKDRRELDQWIDRYLDVEHDIEKDRGEMKKQDDLMLRRMREKPGALFDPMKARQLEAISREQHRIGQRIAGRLRQLDGMRRDMSERRLPLIIVARDRLDALSAQIQKDGDMPKDRRRALESRSEALTRLIRTIVLTMPPPAAQTPPPGFRADPAFFESLERRLDQIDATLNLLNPPIRKAPDEQIAFLLGLIDVLAEERRPAPPPETQP